jgi:hypothetical protein
LKCPNCGKQVLDEEASFCPYCAKPLKSIQKRTSLPITALPITAGILTIIAACIIITIGIICVVEALSSYGLGYGYGYIGGVNIFLWVTGIFGIIVFPISLIGSIFSFKRRYIAIPIFGISLLLTSGVLLLVLNTTGVLLSISIWIYGLAIIVLSTLSVIFVAVSKGAFT